MSIQTFIFQALVGGYSVRYIARARYYKAFKGGVVIYLHVNENAENQSIVRLYDDSGGVINEIATKKLSEFQF